MNYLRNTATLTGGEDQHGFLSQYSTCTTDGSALRGSAGGSCIDCCPRLLGAFTARFHDCSGFGVGRASEQCASTVNSELVIRSELATHYYTATAYCCLLLFTASGVCALEDMGKDDARKEGVRDA